MTPKEKAQELVNKMYHYQWREKQRAKECTLIAVEEILSAHLFDLDEKQYWQQVRTEIENI